MTKTLFVSGHLTDAPDRPKPRFPDTPDSVDRVLDQMKRVFDRWDVGDGWTVITGGARGADLLAADEALNRGASVTLRLALEKDAFIARSVRTSHPAPARDWISMFEAVHQRAAVGVLPTASDSTSNGSVFTRANTWMLDELERATEPFSLLVWDGQRGLEGGTGGVASRADGIVTNRSSRMFIIDPTPRAYEWRQRSPGPKRILALDGGGLRGIISLEILLEIESQLRRRLGRHDLVLADYFDYVAGTSTGAIIATALALGRSVDEVRDGYRQLGRAAFKWSAKALLQGARFTDHAVREQLSRFFPDQLTLGDPRLKTLLLLVMHNTKTDSPWLLSSCTRAKYNRTNRLRDSVGGDRNLDLPLLSLIRASTAAPTFFAPESVFVGKPFTFQDGGVTAFNNPALIAAVMATLPEYGLSWPKGTDDLLVVSIGTGSRASLGRRSRLRLIGAARNLLNLPSVFMNGGAFSQDLLCRVIGDCRFGPVIDSEVGTLIGQRFRPDDNRVLSDDQALSEELGIPLIGEYFSYVRYDTDLGSEEDLAAAGVPEPDWQKVRRMEATSQIKNWERIGIHASAQVDVDEHFQGFLTLPEKRG